VGRWERGGRGIDYDIIILVVCVVVFVVVGYVTECGSGDSPVWLSGDAATDGELFGGADRASVEGTARGSRPAHTGAPSAACR